MAKIELNGKLQAESLLYIIENINDISSGVLSDKETAYVKS